MSDKLHILNKILDFLKENKQATIYKISKTLNIGWETTKNNLDILRNLGLISTEEDKYILRRTSNNTYFNLPLTREQEDLAKLLFSKIKEILARREEETLNLKIQKISYEVIKDLNLNIPIGLYKQGAISIYGNYDDLDFENKFENKFIREIEKNIEKELDTTFKGTIYGNGFVYKQYEKHADEEEIFRLYLQKFNLTRNLNKKEIYEVILKDFLFIQRFLPNEEIFKLENENFKKIIDILLDDKFKENNNVLFIYLENCFSAFWDCFSLKNFEKTLFEDGKLNLTQKELSEYFKTDYELKKETFEYHFDTLQHELSKL